MIFRCLCYCSSLDHLKVIDFCIPEAYLDLEKIPFGLKILARYTTRFWFGRIGYNWRTKCLFCATQGIWICLLQVFHVCGWSSLLWFHPQKQDFSTLWWARFSLGQCSHKSGQSPSSRSATTDGFQVRGKKKFCLCELGRMVSSKSHHRSALGISWNFHRQSPKIRKESSWWIQNSQCRQRWFVP